MSKRSGSKLKQRVTAQRPHEGASALPAHQEDKVDRKPRADSGRRSSWAGNRLAMLRFVIILGVLIIGFNACYYLWISQSRFMHGYLDVYAKVSAAILSVMGDHVSASGRLVTSPRFSMSIAIGCDAIQASAFFVFAVLATPSSVSLVSRVPYVLIGLLFLWFLNLVRIITLFLTGVYFHAAFEVMHIEVWQAVFIFVPLIMWIVWSRRVMRTEDASDDVSH